MTPLKQIAEKIEQVISLHPNLEPEKRQFALKAGALALIVQNKFDLPASVIMAQSLLETEWGQSIEGNNLYGIKAHNGRGD